MVRSGLAVALRSALFLVAYLASFLLVRALGTTLFPESVIWPPAGLAVSGLVLLGWRYWPVITLGTLIQRIAVGYTFPWLLLAPVASTFEALAGYWVLHRLGLRRDFSRLQDGFALLLAATLAPAVSATIGRTKYIGHPDTSFFYGWMSWWRMNALGLLVVVPLALTWASLPWPRPRTRALVEITLMGAMLVGLAWLLTSVGATPDDSGIVLSYLSLPLAIYAGVRFGVRGAATAAAGIVVVALLGTAQQVGPFVHPAAGGIAPHARVFALQAVIAIVMASPMLLGAAISERESARARVVVEREEREHLLASINRNVNEGLFRIAPRQGFVSVNTAFARILGYDRPEDLLGRAPETLFAEAGAGAATIARVCAQGRLDHEEVVLRRCDGTPVPALVSCTLLRGPGGEAEVCDGAVSDITGRKVLEEQLRTTQKMEALGKLAGGVAHDFNNLLTVIGGHAEMLRTALPADSPGREHAREIAVAAARAGRLTHQLLAYSRRQMLTLEVLDLREIIESMTSMLRRLIGEDVRLVTHHAADPLRAQVDRGQIEQVVLNLVVNARDAMTSGGTLFIETTSSPAPEALARAPADLPPAPLACLCVRDTGRGMEPEVVRRAFDPFFTTKEPGKGTGLGLATVDGIVRQSGGVAWIESALGAGTAVYVCLPRVTSDPAARSAAARDAAREAGLGTVLVVEDEHEVRDLVARVLERAGYTVLVAGDGREALDVAVRTEGEIDLLVTDAVMPRMGGRELIARLTAEQPGLRALLMTGYSDATAGQAGDPGPRVPVLQKPFTPRLLLEQVRGCLAAPPPG